MFKNAVFYKKDYFLFIFFFNSNFIKYDNYIEFNILFNYIKFNKSIFY